MPTMKKWVTLLLAALMLLSLTVVAGAEGEGAKYTISAPANSTHTYEVYQIFTGDLTKNEAGDDVLSNVLWGKNGTREKDAPVDENILNELKNTTGTNQEKLSVVTNYVNLSEPFGTVTAEQALEVPAGYYLIKDSSLGDGVTDDSFSTYIVQVANDVSIDPKTAKPTVDKEIQDESTDAEADHKEGWKETADHELFESFDFRLIVKFEADNDYSDYTEYKVVFEDTMSDGITFESIKSVKVDGVAFGVDEYTCTAAQNQQGGSWTLTIENIIKDGVDLKDGAEVVVVYSAHLNEKAQIHDGTSNNTTNKNEVVLKYSNNPHDPQSLGETLPDSVWAFTYGVNNTKYANQPIEGNELPGAGFTLYDSMDNVVPLIKIDNVYYVFSGDEIPGGAIEVLDNEMITLADGKLNIKGLDHGTYTLKETTVPDGYNKCEDITIKIVATHMENTDGTTSVTLGGESTMTNKIINKSGATLPETGGIGTTIFYVAGGVLVLLAVVLLVTKRRMGEGN